MKIDDIYGSKDEVSAIENDDLIETVLEIKAEGNTDDNQCRLMDGINEGIFLIPVVPSHIDDDEVNGADIQRLQFECMASIDKPTGNKYLPLCTDKTSLDSFVDGAPHNTLCLPFTDIAMLLEGLDEFVSVAISSRFFHRDLYLPPSVLPILAARRDESLCSNAVPAQAVH